MPIHGVNCIHIPARCGQGRSGDLHWPHGNAIEILDEHAMTMNFRTANQQGLERLSAASPQWIDMQSAREALALDDYHLLHAGPPIEWGRMCAPMRGAVVANILFEGWAASVEDALQLAEAGRITFAPCHSRHAVGPMTGVISPSQPLIVVRDATSGMLAYSYIGEP
ncbi:MAG: DUF1116 domain-containing protein, partial [Betaproteobacteria bacterium]